MPTVRFEVADRIATITLDRPPVNALSSLAITEFTAALRVADSDDTVRAVIVTGAGRCFTAGLDLKEQYAAIEAGEAGPARLGPAMYRALLEGVKPTIAAINGPALGAGVGIAASCCILVASSDARFGLPEIDVGMLGGARHAMRILGHSTVNRMLLTGHQLDARELLERRVVEACVPPAELLDCARSIAGEIASKDPLAIRMARRSLARIETMGVLDGYEYEMALARELSASPGARAAMAGFVGGGARAEPKAEPDRD